jgi:asparagine synthase (glutamine-hydrolysing)
MGILVAVRDKSGLDSSAHLLRLLDQTGGPKQSIVGVAKHDSSEIFQENPTFTSLISSSLIAYKTSNPREYPPQPLVQSSGAFIFDGLIYDTNRPDTLEAADIMEKNIELGLTRLISERAAAFTVVAVDENSILCGRDQVGSVPLYIGENEETIIVSSNMKTIGREGLRPQPVLPGHLYKLTNEGVQQRAVKRMEKPKTIDVSLEEAKENLNTIIFNVAESISQKVSEGAIAFSGGIDSTLIAYYLKEAGIRLNPICFGVGDREEYRYAKRAAEALDFPLEIVSITPLKLEESIEDIVKSVEKPDPMSVSVGAPLYFASLKAVEMGHTTIFSGNGSDEVFGGYMKYLELHIKGGDPSNSMYFDTVNSWINNMDRDHKICIDRGLDLLLPFANPTLIRYGLSLPLKYKLPNNLEAPRKIILRELAKDLGIPNELSNRPKKAAQYSTGVQKALTNIAKKHGLQLCAYLEDKFNETR